MTINYFYDPKTKEYKEERPAQFSKKGTPLPALDSTTIKPLKEKEGFAVIWNGKKWIYAEDHRQKQDPKEGKVGGTPYWLPEDDYTSQARYMTEIGELPKDALLEKPQPPLDIAKENKKNELKSEYQMSLNGSITVDGFAINANETAYTDISNLIANYSDTVQFRGYDNTFKAVKKDDLIKFQQAVYTFLQEKRQKYWNYQTQIANCTSNKELDKLVFNFGE